MAVLGQSQTDAAVSAADEVGFGHCVPLCALNHLGLYFSFSRKQQKSIMYTSYILHLVTEVFGDGYALSSV